MNASNVGFNLYKNYDKIKNLYGACNILFNHRVCYLKNKDLLIKCKHLNKLFNFTDYRDTRLINFSILDNYLRDTNTFVVFSIGEKYLEFKCIIKTKEHILLEIDSLAKMLESFNFKD